MKTKHNPYHYLRDRFYGSHLDFRVRLFNMLATMGVLAGTIMGTINAVNTGLAMSVFTGLTAAALSFGLMVYANATGRYKICYLITIAVIFIFYFPYLYFTLGGYHGSKIGFFIFAVVYTAYMLEGKTAWAVIAFELVFYIGVFIFSYVNPGIVTPLPAERNYMIDAIVNLVFVGLALSVTLLQHLGMYNQQQKKLDEQNAILESANRAKTEFLANASHEMRTPLTVTSVNVQVVMKMLEDMGEDISDPEARELLAGAQSEIMRLSRMVGGMLTLASMSENTDRQKLDYSALLHSGTEMLRLTLSERGNTLETNIENELIVFGNADLLAQVLTNILQNVRAYTENCNVMLNAHKKGGEIIVTVRDTGMGIPPELLPNVFERGVSTDGTGFGLYLCKTVVESHGGRIWIESEPGKGTAVFYILPVYEGQFGGAEK
jgi:signal transduction histidine kinase